MLYLTILLTHIDKCIQHLVFLKLFSEFKDSNTNESNSDIGINDILLWAVIFNRRELAELYWLRGKDRLCKQNKDDKHNFSLILYIYIYIFIIIIISLFFTSNHVKKIAG